MSYLLPTKEQEAAADKICEWCECGYDVIQVAPLADIAMLLVERDEAREAVIRRLRSVVHRLLFVDESGYAIMDRVLRNDARQAMLESAQYEVNE
jgi:hypothetical protein